MSLGVKDLRTSIFKEEVVLLFFHEWDGSILKKLVEELLFHDNVSLFHSIHHDVLHLIEKIRYYLLNL